ncbi:cell division protein CrgA [Nocardiopsis sp. MG754419]|uniref:cell division protein CrgA n=1 Tax=Nocardiopsis sp. MG754419 TaxID=2259865 RepID=UPI001BAD1149|nr:cell division protein CrgA [Nocardiopsis sp. MG754419]MBR8742267.1 cell division protein CrgA [Nocardiopsis sp. MG754419]
MPKSRNDRKKKAVYTPPPSKEQPKVSPRWLVPTMLGFFILGILWIGVYYIAGSYVPYMQDLNNWNLLIGFSGIIVAVILSTRWH